MNRKITEGHVETIDSCEVCGCAEFTRLATVTTDDDVCYATYVICTGCGLVFHSTRPTKDWRSEYQAYQSRAPLRLSEIKEQHRYQHYQEILERVSRYIPDDARVLDVGTGPGSGLKAFVEAGYQVLGIETHPARACWARDHHGLPVITDRFPETTLPVESFDLVILSHILEHIHNPISVLEAARRIITNSGVLYVEVPNLWNWTHWWGPLHTEHIYNFTPNSLQFVLQQAGFRIIESFEIARLPGYLLNIGVLTELTPIEVKIEPKLPKQEHEALRRHYLREISPLPGNGYAQFRVPNLGYEWTRLDFTKYYVLSCSDEFLVKIQKHKLFRVAFWVKVARRVGLYELLRRMYHWIKK